MIVSDLIKGSLRLIGAIASGETPSAAEVSDGLLALNHLLESWSIEGYLISEKVREVFPLTAGQSQYTMGPGGNFNTTRPINVTEAAALSGSVEVPIDVIGTQEYAAIIQKTIQSTLPQKLYCEGSSPLEKIDVWPVPTSATDLVIYSIKPLASYASETDTVTLPLGYVRALRYNLALELAPEFGIDPSAIVADRAEKSKADIQRNNYEALLLTSDAAGLIVAKPFNIYTGE